MKALSIKQPWVELILSGKKKIELRKWNTKFRGKFLIHSSKIPDKKAMKKFSFSNLPCGFILGKANLSDVKKYNDTEEFRKDKNLHLSERGMGGYGFILRDVKRVKPTEAKGKLGFWIYRKNIFG